MRRIAVLMSFGLLIASASAASAQDFARPQRSSIDGVEFLVGYMDYDLSGTGSTVPIVVRGTKALTGNLSLEFGGTFATPQQQFGGSSFLAPEVRVDDDRWEVIRRRQTLDDVMALESSRFQVPRSRFHVRVRRSGSRFRV